MLTRRAVLTGTAAASIAAIAHARGVEAAPPEGFGGCGFGGLADAAVGVFYKEDEGFSAFYKFREIAAELFFKETGFDKVEVFFKVFAKGWSPLLSKQVPLTSLANGEGYFSKLGPHIAEIFVRGPNDLGVFAKVESNPDGGFDISFTSLDND